MLACFVGLVRMQRLLNLCVVVAAAVLFVCLVWEYGCQLRDRCSASWHCAGRLSPGWTALGGALDNSGSSRSCCCLVHQ